MCIFYLRLTSNLLGYRIRIYIGFGLIASTWLTVLFSILFGCGLPFEKNWQINPNPGNFCQPAISKLDILMTVVLNVMTDLCKSRALSFFPGPSLSFSLVTPVVLFCSRCLELSWKKEKRLIMNQC